MIFRRKKSRYCYLYCKFDVFIDKLVIEVDEKKPQGENFWHDFGKLYPELDPYQILYGVIYLSDRSNNSFELDGLPKSEPTDLLDLVLKYSWKERAYYVEFYLGDWHSHLVVKVLSYSQIMGSGIMGKKLPEWWFRLK